MARSTKERLADELRELSINAAYLSLFLCTFSVYRSVVTGGIREKALYLQLGTSIITAVVIAKSIMLGGWLNLGERRTKHRRVISRTLYKSLVYGAFVFLVTIVERIIEGFIHGTRATDTLQLLATLGWQEITARTLVILLALVPYFALREVAALEGRDDLFQLFFRAR